MVKLIGYAMMSANNNAIDEGHLVKAMCGFCGRKLYQKISYLYSKENGKKY
jgi:hypothetical protein